MAEDKLSAREAALIAQARAQLAKPAVARGGEPAGAVPSQENRPSGAAVPEDRSGAAPAQAAQTLDPAERIATLMQAARAESERVRQRRRRLYVWAPVAFMAALGLWTLMWLWHTL